MGMESFNAEPVVPDESERVDDATNAEEIAYAGKQKRDEAARYREFADPATPFVIKDGKKWLGETGYELNEPEEPIRASYAAAAKRVDDTAHKFETIEKWEISKNQ